MARSRLLFSALPAGAFGPERPSFVSTSRSCDCLLNALYERSCVEEVVGVSAAK
jgi:hypothetical protein